MEEPDLATSACRITRRRLCRLLRSAASACDAEIQQLLKTKASLLPLVFAQLTREAPGAEEAETAFRLGSTALGSRRRDSQRGRQTR